MTESPSLRRAPYGDITNTVAGGGIVTWENGGIASNGYKYRGHALERRAPSTASGAVV